MKTARPYVTPAILVACAGLFVAGTVVIAETGELIEKAKPPFSILSEIPAGQDDGAIRETKVAADGIASDAIPDRFSFEVDRAGTYVLSVPSDPVEIVINGQSVLDPDPADAPPEESVQVFISLQEGAHLIEFEAKGEAVLSRAYLDQVSIARLGQDPVAILETADPLEPGEMPVTHVAAATSSTTGQTTQVALAEPNLPERFEIGGRNRSGAQPAPASSDGSAPGTTPVPTGGTQMASAGGATETESSSGGGSTTSVPVVPASLGSGSSGGSGGGSGGSGGGTGGGGTGGGGGQPTAGGGGGGTPTPTPTPTPLPPSTPPATGGPTVGLGPLAPPTDVEPTMAVQLLSAGDDATTISSTGQTLFGAVMDPAAFDVVDVTVAPSGRTDRVEVGPNTGQFAVRLFEEDLSSGNVTITLTGASTASDEVATAAVSYTFDTVLPADGAAQALSRMTFGPTPELYSRVRAQGFAAYVEEQLNPDSIDDSFFENSGLDELGDEETTSSGRFFENIMYENLAYAMFSEKQLQEVVGDFWWNHFHAINKDSSIVHQALTDRRFFRENAFGRFEDLLLYSARSPLMSQYLDNDQSRAGNLNENYGREILELHTVGVDGGYGDDDVIAVSRIFTGWRYDEVGPENPDSSVQRRYEFEFQPDRHDSDDKVIPFLATTIAGRSGDAGVEEGEELIAMLAEDPRTIDYVCGKLVQRLVADTPPQQFIDACAAAWVANDGNTGEIVRAILLHPDFTTLAKSKTKTPFEYAVSVARAFGMQPGGDMPASDFLRRFREASWNAGYNSFRFPAPTGLAEYGTAWTTSAAFQAQYNKILEIADQAGRHNSELQQRILDAGLETTEEVAAYLFAVATADRFRPDEFEALLAELRGPDGIFEPMTEDEGAAFDRAIATIAVMPSFHVQ